MQHWLKPLIIVSLPVIFWGLDSQLALASQRWEGNGRIIRGAGKGASVPALQLETEALDTEAPSILFLNGPDAGEQVELTREDSIETESGIWQFLHSEETLEANLYQEDPYRVIHYQLTPIE